MTEFARGAGYLREGFRLMRQRPRLYLIGLIPALVVFLVLGTLFVLMLVNLGAITGWLTPFADDWNDTLRTVLRFCVGAGLVVGSVILWSATFTGLTLTVGDPFYEHVWRQVEDMLGPQPLGDGVGFWRSALDGVKLALVGLACSVVVLLSGFIPVIGPVLGIVLGVLLTGRLLARELVVRPFEGRGIEGVEQKQLLAPHGTRVLGFGVVTQLCFFIPLGGVLVMPAAVAGATALARDVLPEQRWQAVKAER